MRRLSVFSTNLGKFSGEARASIMFESSSAISQFVRPGISTCDVTSDLLVLSPEIELSTLQYPPPGRPREREDLPADLTASPEYLTD